jgi:hypothetical protein
MRGCLPGRKADDVRFHAAFSIAQQGSAKAARFVVRMGGKTKEPKHLFSLYPSLIK